MNAHEVVLKAQRIYNEAMESLDVLDDLSSDMPEVERSDLAASLRMVRDLAAQLGAVEEAWTHD